ncbi:subtilase cytotoxin subunit B [Salmonella enterica]|nr:subtilase cytotoxin subunit B [Salmonella enterica]
MKKVILFIVFSLFSVNSALAEWTGDHAEGMYSNVIINKFHTGQISSQPYFCIEAFKTSSNIKACLIKNTTVWGASYGTLYDQALYYYTTGQSVRVYYAPGVWTYSPFVSALTSNALVGLSTCEPDACFGPNREVEMLNPVTTHKPIPR